MFVANLIFAYFIGFGVATYALLAGTRLSPSAVVGLGVLIGAFMAGLEWLAHG